MSNYRNHALQMGTKARLDLLQCYAISPRYGHDTARRYVFETAEAMASMEDRERAAAMLYEVADAVVGRIPLPDTLFPPVEKPAAPAPTAEPKVETPKPSLARVFWNSFLKTLTSRWLGGFIIGFLVGKST